MAHGEAPSGPHQQLPAMYARCSHEESAPPNAVALLPYIKRALQKVEQETYGICDTCEGEIPAARLEALPYAIRCVTCQEVAT